MQRVLRTCPSAENPFRIGGRNPVPARCRRYIEAQQDAGPNGDLRFAYAIAKHETHDRNGTASRYNHFWNVDGRWNRVRQEAGFPVLNNDDAGEPGGYGLFQVTMPDIPRKAIWNWQDNVAEALRILASKRTEVVTFMNAQRQQAALANAPLPAHSVEGVRFADGTGRTMEHALTIKAYNGSSRPSFAFVDNGQVPGFILDPHSSGHYCFWRSAFRQQTSPNSTLWQDGAIVTANPPAWALSRLNANNRNYVADVCIELEP